MSETQTGVEQDDFGTVRLRLVGEQEGRLEAEQHADTSILRHGPGGAVEGPISDSQRLFQALYDAALVTAIDGTIEEANSRAEEFLEYSHEELCGRNVVDVIAGGEPGILLDIRDNLEHGRFVLIDAYCTRRDESYFPAEIAVSRAELRGDERLCFFIRNITRRARAEADRKALEDRLQQSQKLESLGMLAGGVAHDFNNLLMAIMGNADLAIEEMDLSSPGRQNVEEINRVSRHAADLCRQLLAYSGKGRFVVEPVDLSRIARDMSRIVQVSIGKTTDLVEELADGLPPVLADSSQIRQVMLNLITNAADATETSEAHGVIAVSTSVREWNSESLAHCAYGSDLAPGTYVSLRVSDSGCGMDEDTLKRVFDPFFTTKLNGRGLGLAAVLGIVRGHRGAIIVESEPDKGTSFEILLPPTDQETPTGHETDAVSVRWQGSGTVLVVDDEPGVLSVAEKMVALAGFEVLTAQDGASAMELFSERHDDIVCVLLDLTMPGMDGAEVAGKMRGIHSGIPIVIASGFSEKDIMTRFPGEGPEAFVQKPYALGQLHKVLRHVLGGA